jgi:hypothetical protein
MKNIVNKHPTVYLSQVDCKYSTGLKESDTSPLISKRPWNSLKKIILKKMNPIMESKITVPNINIPVLNIEYLGIHTDPKRNKELVRIIAGYADKKSLIEIDMYSIFWLEIALKINVANVPMMK